MTTLMRIQLIPYWAFENYYNNERRSLNITFDKAFPGVVTFMALIAVWTFLHIPNLRKHPLELSHYLLEILKIITLGNALESERNIWQASPKFSGHCLRYFYDPGGSMIFLLHHELIKHQWDPINTFLINNYCKERRILKTPYLTSLSQVFRALSGIVSWPWW